MLLFVPSFHLPASLQLQCHLVWDWNCWLYVQTLHCFVGSLVLVSPLKSGKESTEQFQNCFHRSWDASHYFVGDLEVEVGIAVADGSLEVLGAGKVVVEIAVDYAPVVVEGAANVVQDV